MRFWTQRTLRNAASLWFLAGTSWGAVHADELKHSSLSLTPVSTDKKDLVYLPYAQFHIPFNLDQSGAEPSSVHLYVSTDQGLTWQLHGRTVPSEKHFEFRAAAEGEYLFTVQTVDSSGVSFPSPSPPLRVLVDTTKPQATIQADLDHNGSLIVDLRLLDPHLDVNSATLRVRTDKDTNWREVAIEHLSRVGDHYEGQVELILPACREVLMILSVTDLAKNTSEASFRYSMPRTAVGHSDLQLASSRPDITLPGARATISNPQNAQLPGAIAWDAESEKQFSSRVGKSMASKATTGLSSMDGQHSAGDGAFPTSPLQNSSLAASNDPGAVSTDAKASTNSPGRLATSQSKSTTTSGLNNLSLDSSNVEEIPAPRAVGSDISGMSNELVLEDANGVGNQPQQSLGSESPQKQFDEDGSLQSQVVDSQDPYYCKSRTFSLDYSVEALGGNLLSEVELWGTEDGGRNWHKWGTDPDRTSPFDVRVGNDGLFGFRMVIIGQNGSVLGQPNAGEQADVWIHVDTEVPLCRITRAVYGDGSEKGMLVIDYTCSDSLLADQPLSLSHSTSSDGPWTLFATSLKNTGLYLWKVDPNVPNQVYLKLEAVDKAGNTAVHQLELPIDIKGLSPRGRIQGFRPILEAE